MASNVFDECIWAKVWPDLQKSLYLARVCLKKPPKKCQFRNVPSTLQTGPTCGLVTIAMLTEEKAENLLVAAKALGFSNNGEMFSADYLHRLFCDTSEKTATAENLESTLFEGHLNCDRIKQYLIDDNACMLVAYDPDFNHSPCLRQGHRAHWALIIGYLISDDDDFFVIARHGKTANRVIWSLKALADSNSNMVEFAQPKGYPDLDFLLPPGGIAGESGLRDRAIVIKGLKHEIITIR